MMSRWQRHAHSSRSINRESFSDYSRYKDQEKDSLKSNSRDSRTISEKDRRGSRSSTNKNALIKMEKHLKQSEDDLGRKSHTLKSMQDGPDAVKQTTSLSQGMKLPANDRNIKYRGGNIIRREKTIGRGSKEPSASKKSDEFKPKDSYEMISRLRDPPSSQSPQELEESYVNLSALEILSGKPQIQRSDYFPSDSRYYSATDLASATLHDYNKLMQQSSYHNQNKEDDQEISYSWVGEYLDESEDENSLVSHRSNELADLHHDDHISIQSPAIDNTSDSELHHRADTLGDFPIHVKLGYKNTGSASQKLKIISEDKNKRKIPSRGVHERQPASIQDARKPEWECDEEKQNNYESIRYAMNDEPERKISKAGIQISSKKKPVDEASLIEKPTRGRDYFWDRFEKYDDVETADRHLLGKYVRDCSESEFGRFIGKKSNDFTQDEDDNYRYERKMLSCKSFDTMLYKQQENHDGMSTSRPYVESKFEERGKTVFQRRQFDVDSPTRSDRVKNDEYERRNQNQPAKSTKFHSKMLDLSNRRSKCDNEEIVQSSNARKLLRHRSSHRPSDTNQRDERKTMPTTDHHEKKSSFSLPSHVYDDEIDVDCGREMKDFPKDSSFQQKTQGTNHPLSISDFQGAWKAATNASIKIHDYPNYFHHNAQELEVALKSASVPATASIFSSMYDGDSVDKLNQSQKQEGLSNDNRIANIANHSDKREVLYSDQPIFSNRDEVQKASQSKRYFISRTKNDVISRTKNDVSRMKNDVISRTKNDVSRMKAELCIGDPPSISDKPSSRRILRRGNFDPYKVDDSDEFWGKKFVNWFSENILPTPAFKSYMENVCPKMSSSDVSVMPLNFLQHLEDHDKFAMRCIPRNPVQSKILLSFLDKYKSLKMTSKTLETPRETSKIEKHNSPEPQRNTEKIDKQSTTVTRNRNNGNIPVVISGNMMDDVLNKVVHVTEPTMNTEAFSSVLMTKPREKLTITCSNSTNVETAGESPKLLPNRTVVNEFYQSGTNQPLNESGQSSHEQNVVQTSKILIKTTTMTRWNSEVQEFIGKAQSSNSRPSYIDYLERSIKPSMCDEKNKQPITTASTNNQPMKEVCDRGRNIYKEPSRRVPKDVCLSRSRSRSPQGRLMKDAQRRPSTSVHSNRVKLHEKKRISESKGRPLGDDGDLNNEKRKPPLDKIATTDETKSTNQSMIIGSGSTIIHHFKNSTKEHSKSYGSKRSHISCTSEAMNQSKKVMPEINKSNTTVKSRQSSTENRKFSRSSFQNKRSSSPRRSPDYEGIFGFSKKKTVASELSSLKEIEMKELQREEYTQFKRFIKNLASKRLNFFYDFDEYDRDKIIEVVHDAKNTFTRSGRSRACSRSESIYILKEMFLDNGADSQVKLKKLLTERGDDWCLATSKQFLQLQKEIFKSCEKDLNKKGSFDSQSKSCVNDIVEKYEQLFPQFSGDVKNIMKMWTWRNEALKFSTSTTGDLYKEMFNSAKHSNLNDKDELDAWLLKSFHFPPFNSSERRYSVVLSVLQTQIRRTKTEMIDLIVSWWREGFCKHKYGKIESVESRLSRDHRHSSCESMIVLDEDCGDDMQQSVMKNSDSDIMEHDVCRHGNSLHEYTEDDSGAPTIFLY